MKEIIIICLLYIHAGGDNRNVLGTANALQNKIPSSQEIIYISTDYKSDPEKHNLEVSNAFRKIKERHTAAKTYIALGAGEEGYYSLLTIKNIGNTLKENIYAHWSGHQVYNFITSPSTTLINSITMPSYAITEKTRTTLATFNVTLNETPGLPHNVTERDLEKEYLELKTEITPADKYLLIVLAGDAPNPNNEMLYFTKKEARKLAAYVAKQAIKNNQFILVTDGPRTGKYDHKTGKLTNRHKLAEPLNEVSEAFLTELSNSLPNKNKQYQFFSFKFLEAGKIQSAYKALLYVIKQTEGSVAYIPGESISMLAESIDNLPNSQIIAYENQAMNSNHDKYLEQIHQEGITLLRIKNNGYILEECHHKTQNKSIISDAERVADFIIHDLRLEHE